MAKTPKMPVAKPGKSVLTKPPVTKPSKGKPPIVAVPTRTKPGC